MSDSGSRAEMPPEQPNTFYATQRSGCDLQVSEEPARLVCLYCARPVETDLNSGQCHYCKSLWPLDYLRANQPMAKGEA